MKLLSMLLFVFALSANAEQLVLKHSKMCVHVVGKGNRNLVQVTCG